jgi:hypothetical protein
MKHSEKSSSIPRLHRFSTVQLLIALALFFIWAPFVEEIEGGDLIVSGLFSLVLLAGVVAVADSKRVLVIAIVLAIPFFVRRRSTLKCSVRAFPPT